MNERCEWSEESIARIHSEEPGWPQEGFLEDRRLYLGLRYLRNLDEMIGFKKIFTCSNEPH